MLKGVLLCKKKVSILVLFLFISFSIPFFVTFTAKATGEAEKENNLYINSSESFDKLSGDSVANPPTISEHFTVDEIIEFLSKLKTGDIIVSNGYTSSTDLSVPGYWTHCSIFNNERFNSSNPYCLLSASNDTEQGTMKVGYEPAKKYIYEKEIAAIRIKNYDSNKAQAAIKYAEQFIGKPYSIKTSRTDNEKWYCSKLVYRAWLSQGINLEPQPRWGDLYVTPSDLYNDDDTYEISRIKGK